MRWAISPIISSSSEVAFGDYDRRASFYTHFYAPLLWLRDNVPGIDSVAWSYESLFRPRKPTINSISLSTDYKDATLYTRSFICYPNFLTIPGKDSTTTIIDCRSFFLQNGASIPPDGYAYLLPLSKRLVLRSKIPDFGLVSPMVSSGSNDTSLAIAVEANLD
jgi:hypothetical protein